MNAFRDLTARNAKVAQRTQSFFNAKIISVLSFAVGVIDLHSMVEDFRTIGF